MEIINQIHSVLRYIILALLIAAIFKSFIGMTQKKSFTTVEDKMGLFLTIFVDIQLLIGLVQYFFGALGWKNIQNIGMGEVMKNSYSRFFAMEHILMMLIALALIHIGRAKSRKAFDDLTKHKNSFWFYLIALLLILAAIPWPFRKGFEGLGWL